MIIVNAVLGIFAFLCGMTLVASIALNIQTQKLLMEMQRELGRSK